jgi:hypothetical protein
MVAIGGFGPAGAATPRFYSDDPIAREPDPQDASVAAYNAQDMLYELTYNSFALSGRKPENVRAQNLNTIDEVPDSAWFTNRVGARPVSVDEIVRGPNLGEPPDPSHWVITREKISGSKVGVTAKDARGETWFLEFDPPYFPEAATSALVMNSKFWWGAGYNVVESYITTFDPKRMTIEPEARFMRPNGKRTPGTRRDIERLLERVARNPDGTYRAMAGRLIPGRIIGTFRYEGTRPDDPNDLVPHQHRRELRGMFLFGAWTNTADFKGANTMDTLLPTDDGRMVVKHYIQDLGSSFGTANDRYAHDLGWEHFIEMGTAMKRVGTFNLGLPRWATVKYEASGPSLGKLAGDDFDPRKWRTHVPNAATIEMRDDDAFWAARKIAGFTEEMVRAIVHTGEFSDPAAERALVDVMMKRREKILRAYLPAVNPIVTPKLENNRLSFENAAVAAGVASEPELYRASWFQFDNATGDTRPLSDTSSPTTTIDAPADLPTKAGTYVLVEISADSKEHQAWQQPIRTYFHAETDGWKLVGLERMPDGPRAPEAQLRAAEERLR